MGHVFSLRGKSFTAREASGLTGKSLCTQGRVLHYNNDILAQWRIICNAMIGLVLGDLSNYRKANYITGKMLYT